MRDFPGNDNYGKPRSLHVAKVQAMTDDQLYNETKHKIWLSAYASNNRRSDYHWHVSVCFDECEDRGKPEIYTRAYNHASGAV
jgi:hypothetical protein